MWSAEVPLSVMVATFEPTPPLMVVTPAPAPTLSILPALLTLDVEKVMPLAVASFMVRLLVPVTPPVKTVLPPLSCNVRVSRCPCSQSDLIIERQTTACNQKPGGMNIRRAVTQGQRT